MFYARKQIKNINPKVLDELLERGWFRMGNSVFTTQFLFFDEKMYATIWLRVALPNFTFKKKHRKLINKVEKNFRVEINQANFNQEKDELYEVYKKNFKGKLHSSISMCMLDDSPFNAFNTLECCIYDNDKLIAFSFFDKGAKTIASIMAAYHPDYQKFSLGIYTMLAEMKYALTHNFEFYYPGYFVPNYKRFDYKFEFGNTEFYFFPTKKWIDFSTYNNTFNISSILKMKVQKLFHFYKSSNLQSYIFVYRNFEMGSFDPNYGKVFFHPLMVISSIKNRHLQKELIVITEYSLVSQTYRLIEISLPKQFFVFHNDVLFEDQSILVIENFLEPKKVLFESENIEATLAQLLFIKKSFKNLKP